MREKKDNIKSIPMRTCIATGEKFPKKELLRIVSKDGGFVEFDITGKKQGRGANISMTHEALELALKKRAFNRAFARAITHEEIQYLKDNFDEAVEEKKFRPSKNAKVSIRVKKEDLDKIL